MKKYKKKVIIIKRKVSTKTDKETKKEQKTHILINV